MCVKSLSRVRLFVIPWTVAHQAPLSMGFSRQVGCHFLLQCMKMKSESEVLSCNPMDCSPPGSSVHGISQARVPELVAISFSRDLPNLGIEPRSPALQADALSSEPPGKPRKAEYTLLRKAEYIVIKNQQFTD